MKKNWPLRSALLITCPALWLAGCAGPFQQSRPQALQNPAVSTDDINITTTELKRIERHAYDKGFADGQAFERTNFSTVKTPTPTPCPVPVTCPAQTAPLKAPSRLPLKPKASLPPPNPTPAYSTSGPAQPLSP